MTPEIAAVENIRVAEFPDKSYIEMYRHRYTGTFAPWIDGPYRVHCGDRDCPNGTFDSIDDIWEAQIIYLTHALQHAQQEISDLRRKVFNGDVHHA